MSDRSIRSSSLYELEDALNQAKVNYEKAKTLFATSIAVLLTSFILLLGFRYIPNAANKNGSFTEEPGLMFLAILVAGSLYLAISSYLHFRKSANDVSHGEFLWEQITKREFRDAY